MIRINLLPPEIRSARSARAFRMPWRFAGFWAVGAVVLLSLALLFFNGAQAGSLRTLQAEWRHLEPEKKKLEQVRQDIQALEKQAEALQRMKGPEGNWAPRLSLLSDTVVPQIWFSSFSGSQGQALRLEGSALAAPDADHNAAVTQFLQRLKEHPDFSRWFRSVELLSVAHRKIGDTEVVDFTILLHSSD